MLKHLCSFLLAVVLALAVLSCSRTDLSSATGGNRNENVLRIDAPAPFGSLDPNLEPFYGSLMIFPLLYSQLFVPNDNGTLEPDLATRWGYDAATLTWTIQLRDDALFHDGRRVTVKDVEYSIRHLLKDQRPQVYSAVDRMTQVGDTTLCISLKENDPSFPMKIWYMSICPEHTGVTDGYQDHPVGSGPFRFNYRKGMEEVGLAAHDGFYGGRPSLDGVVFVSQPDGEKSWARLLAGETDVVFNLSPKDYRIVNRYRQRFYFDARATDAYSILLYNTTDPLFVDPSVRLALAHVVDRKAIIDGVLHGAAVEAIGPAGITSPYHNPDLKPIPYNPTKALELLGRAGWSYSADDHLLHRNGKRFEFTILVFEGSAVDRSVAERLQLYLNDVGIKAHQQFVSMDELLRRYLANNEFQSALTQLSAPARLPGAMLQELWGSRDGKKAVAGMFDHPQVNRLFEEAGRAVGTSRAEKLYHEIDALIASLQPGMFLFHKITSNVMSRRFQTQGRFSLDFSGISKLKCLSPATH